MHVEPGQISTRLSKPKVFPTEYLKGSLQLCCQQLLQKTWLTILTVIVVALLLFLLPIPVRIGVCGVGDGSGSKLECSGAARQWWRAMNSIAPPSKSGRRCLCGGLFGVQVRRRLVYGRGWFCGSSFLLAVGAIGLLTSLANAQWQILLVL